MLVIKIIFLVVVLAAFASGIKRFNKHCSSKFGHTFFDKRAFYITAAAVGLYAIGQMWRGEALHDHGDTMNGVALMVIGGLVAAWLVFDNIKRTDPTYGILGSAASLGLFSALALVWLPLMIIGIGLAAAMTGDRRVYVINR